MFEFYSHDTDEKIDVQSVMAEREKRNANQSDRPSGANDESSHDPNCPINRYNKEFGTPEKMIEFLQKHGYELVNTTENNEGIECRFLSPESSSGSPGTVLFKSENGTYLVYSHHDDVIGKTDKGHDAFSLLALLEFNGDYKAAFKAITQEEPSQVAFNPFTVTADFLADIATLVIRQWIIVKHLLRGYVSVVFSPGAVGKSSFELTKAVSVATGRDILGLGVNESCKVLVINNEDDKDEIERRLAGILLMHNIDPAELVGRLFIQSGYGSPQVFVHQQRNGGITVSPNVKDIQEFVRGNDIGYISIDPFISTHTVAENDNTGIDKVITEYKRLAHSTRCAVCLVHHTRKQGNDTEAGAGDAESGRGASSLKDAARCVDTLARMSEKTAKKIKFDQHERVRHIRLDTGKLNFQLLDPGAKWYRMESIDLPNGDEVGSIKPVNLDPYFERANRDDGRMKWTPTSVAEALHRVMRGDEIAFGEIKGLFMEENNIKDRQARDCATMISNDPNDPTRIRIGFVYFDYWYSKSSKTSPIVIHRRPGKNG